MAYCMFLFQSRSTDCCKSASRKYATKEVHSFSHLTSEPPVTAPPGPFLFRVRISFAPTHLMNHNALVIGIKLPRHCSSSDCPRMPWGMVRLSLLSGTSAFARSASQAFRFASVNVTRGGGLKFDVDESSPVLHLRSSARPRSTDKVSRPDLCLNTPKRAFFAEPISFSGGFGGLSK